MSIDKKLFRLGNERQPISREKTVLIFSSAEGIMGGLRPIRWWGVPCGA
jgi:hypothetical protein